MAYTAAKFQWVQRQLATMPRLTHAQEAQGRRIKRDLARQDY